MSSIYIGSTIWFLIHLVMLYLYAPSIEQFTEFIVFYFLIHGVAAAIYRLITHRMKKIRRAPLSHREFAYVMMLVFGPFGYPAVLLVLIVSGQGRGSGYEAYRDYVDVGEEEFTYSGVEYVSEMKKHMDKEPVIDSIRYGNTAARRAAAEILARMGGERAIRALKNLAMDSEPAIRFVATSRLTGLADTYMNNLEYYGDLIRICGSDPEIMLQYGNMLIEFCECGLLGEEEVPLYADRAWRAYSEVKNHKQYSDLARMGMVRAKRLARHIDQAMQELTRISPDSAGEWADEKARLLFINRDMTQLAKHITEVKMGLYSEGVILKEWLKTEQKLTTESGLHEQAC